MAADTVADVAEASATTIESAPTVDEPAAEAGKWSLRGLVGGLLAVTTRPGNNYLNRRAPSTGRNGSRRRC